MSCLNRIPTTSFIAERVVYPEPGCGWQWESVNSTVLCAHLADTQISTERPTPLAHVITSLDLGKPHLCSQPQRTVGVRWGQLETGFVQTQTWALPSWHEDEGDQFGVGI